MADEEGAQTPATGGAPFPDTGDAPSIGAAQLIEAMEAATQVAIDRLRDATNSVVEMRRVQAALKDAFAALDSQPAFREAFENIDTSHVFKDAAAQPTSSGEGGTTASPTQDEMREILREVVREELDRRHG